MHGKDKVPSQNTVYRWIQDINNGSFKLSIGKTTGRRYNEVNTKKKNVSGCLHLLTPRFSITALPKGKTVDSEYMIKFFQDTRHRFNNIRKNLVII